MDVICQAKSGMGKTAVFVLATLHQLDPKDDECHVVVLVHTRELAFQIQREYERFCKYLPDVKSRVFFGGTNVKADMEYILNNVRVLLSLHTPTFNDLLLHQLTDLLTFFAYWLPSTLS